MAQVTIYTSDTCSICKAVKARLTARGIGYVELNTSHDDTAREFLLGEGIRSVPVVTHGATIFKTPQTIMDFIKSQ